MTTKVNGHYVISEGGLNGRDW